MLSLRSTAGVTSPTLLALKQIRTPVPHMRSDPYVTVLSFLHKIAGHMDTIFVTAKLNHSVPWERNESIMGSFLLDDDY